MDNFDSLDLRQMRNNENNIQYEYLFCSNEFTFLYHQPSNPTYFVKIHFLKFTVYNILKALRYASLSKLLPNQCLGSL